MAEENNPAEAYTNLLKKHNDDANAVALKLFGENFDYRNEIRELKTKLPKEGSVVLSADEVKVWNAYKDLGVEPEKIKESLDKLPTLESENVKLTKRDKLREVEMLGYDIEVLEDRMSAFPNAEITVKKTKDAKDATKEDKTPFVSLDGKESSLDDFAKENFPKFVPVLKVNADQPALPGNTADPKPHKQTPEDSIKQEIQAQSATGRYTL
jgi:hypothetical protein